MAKLIGEIADRRLSGLLCLHGDETAKTIYFESGTPVFAASDVTNEQLEYRLVRDGLVDSDAIEQARGTSLTTEELGANLVEAGALSRETMEQSVRNLAADIILSVFEWQQGDYIFYEDSDPGVSTKLDWTPAECVLAAAQRAAKSDSSAAAVPAQSRLVQTGVSRDSIDGALTLNFLETFVLSAIVTPTPAGEVAALIGFPEAETRNAIDVLLKLGLLKLQFDQGTGTHDQTTDAEEPADQPDGADCTHVANHHTAPEAPDEAGPGPELTAIPPAVTNDRQNAHDPTGSHSINQLIPADGLLVQTNASLDSIPGTVPLSSLEGFVLSVIAAPTTVRDVATLTGLPDAETQNAIRVLLESGLLKLQVDSEQTISNQAAETAEPIDEIAVSTQQAVEDKSAQQRVEMAQQVVEATPAESPVEIAAVHTDDLTPTQTSIDTSTAPPVEAEPQPEPVIRHSITSTDRFKTGLPESESTPNVVPADSRLVQTHESPDSIPGGVVLTSLEGFVLSMVGTPMRIGDIAMLTGLPEAETQSAISALLKLGLLKVEDNIEGSVTDQATQSVTARDQQPGTISPAQHNEETTAGPVDVTGQAEVSALSTIASTDHGRPAAPTDNGRITTTPADGWLVQTNPDADSMAGTMLSSIDAFVLSAIAAPTRVRDVATVAGLPDAETKAAIDKLLELGLLKVEHECEKRSRVGASDSDRTDQQLVDCAATQPVAGETSEGMSLEWALEVVSARLKTIGSADYYRVLGVDRIAPTSRITTNYNEFKEKLESFLTRWPDQSELTHSAGALIAKIDEAYQTLSDPEKRRAYDRPAGVTAGRKPIKKGKGSKSTIVPGGAASSGSEFTPAPFSVSFDPDLKPAFGVSTVKNAPSYDPLEVAGDNFKQGRLRFDRSDFHGAAHHFREAARLDPSKSDYHYYLAVNLSILAQARHTRHSHTHDIGSHVTCTLGGGLARNPRLRREAEQHLLKALELDRKNPDIPLRLARLYQDAGIQKKANHYFLETLMLDPNNAAALRELGLAEQAKERRLAKEKRSPREPVKRSNSRNTETTSVYVIDEADI